jgi:uncharacterized membrane protein SpoIIM required for sporulation/uncharacterized RDD family membrane protein YckC
VTRRPQPQPIDSRVLLETPEHVVLPVSLAGIGARGVAWLIDAGLRGVVFWLVVAGLFGVLPAPEGASEGLMLLAWFVLDWGWYAFWDIVDDGQGPGKRVMRLRVLSADGTPVSVRQALLRNLLRAADALPAVYFVGVVSIIADRRFRRLGDVVAGTVVVREAVEEVEPPAVAIDPPVAPGEVPRLPRHRRVGPRDRQALEEWHAASKRFGMVWSEWVAARVVDDFVRRYQIASPRPVRTLQRLLAAAREAQPELERAAGAARDHGGALERLVGAPGKLAAAQAPAMVWGLRAVVAELGRLRQVAPSRARAAEQVLWRAEARLHRAGPRGLDVSLAPVHRFLVVEFPEALRRCGGWFLLSTALLYVPLLLCAVGAALDPELADRLVSPDMRALEDAYLDPTSRSAEDNAAMAGFYVFNNVGIALRAAAAGAFGGLGTAWVLVSNGIGMGSFAGYLARLGALGNLLRFTSGHAAWELTAITVAGAAGFRLGAAIVSPGALTRAGALRAAGPDVLRLAGGAAVMLLVAASIEGFWSGWVLPDWVKAVFAGVQVVLVVVWLGGFARRSP